MIFFIPIRSVFAASLTVNTTNDTHDASVGDGICADADGSCSLRAAIEEANALAGSDSISLPAGTYTLSLGSELSITSDLTINGAGAEASIIQADADRNIVHYRVMKIVNGVNVTLAGLKIRNGMCDGSCTAVPIYGGGIFNGGTLTLDRVTVSDNIVATYASDGGGIYNGGTLMVQNGSLIGGAGHGNVGGGGAGGIYNSPGSFATIDASTISANYGVNEYAGGGGILNDGGTVNIQNGSVIGGLGAGNTTTLGYPGGGGGIFNTHGGTVTIDASTVSSNVASYGGGGIANEATLIVRNGSVIGGIGAGNSAGYGGGIINFGTTTIDASTVSDNSALNPNPPTGGGGIFNASILHVQNGSVIGGEGAGNNAASWGGGIYNWEGSTTTITDSRILTNTAANSGGVYNQSSGTVNVTASCVVGNSNTSFTNDDSNVQTATGNWWGAVDGPSGAGSGSGDSVSTNVNYSSFLTTPPDGCPYSNNVTPTPTPTPTPSPSPTPTPTPVPGDTCSVDIQTTKLNDYTWENTFTIDTTGTGDYGFRRYYYDLLYKTNSLGELGSGGAFSGSFINYDNENLQDFAIQNWNPWDWAPYLDNWGFTSTGINYTFFSLISWNGTYVSKFKLDNYVKPYDVNNIEVVIYGASYGNSPKVWCSKTGNTYVEPTPTPTSSPTPTPTPTPTPSPTPSPTPTPTPTPVPTMTVTFNDRTANTQLNGTYSGINWGTNVWDVDGAIATDNTNSISFHSSNVTSGTFSFVSPEVLESSQIYSNSNVTAMVTLSCNGNPPVSAQVAPNSLATLVTNWNVPCTTVTVTSSNSWNTNLDNLVYASSSTATPLPTPTPIPNTLGYTNKGALLDTGDSGYMNGTKFTMGGTNKTTTNMSVFVGNVDTGSHNQYQMAIYTDNNGQPKTLVASTQTGTLTPLSWNTLPITASLNANTTYWLMYNTNGTASTDYLNNMYFNPGSTGVAAWAKRAFGSWPANFPSATLDSTIFSIYVHF